MNGSNHAYAISELACSFFVWKLNSLELKSEVDKKERDIIYFL